MPTWGKLSNISRLKDLTTLHRNVTKSSESQTLQSNASPGNKSGSNYPQADFNSSRSVPASRVSAKSRTTSVNGVAVARSGNMDFKSKKPTKKSRVVEISDSEDNDSLEREAALASPEKGAETRKATKVCKSFYISSNMYLKYRD